MQRQAEITLGMCYARIAAKDSNARRLKVGAALLSHGRVISTGFNHMPDFSPCEPDDLSHSYPQVVHAEIDAIGHLVRSGISPKEMELHLYVTHSPCLKCAIELEAYGILSVTYAIDYRSPSGVDFLRAKCIPVNRVEG